MKSNNIYWSVPLFIFEIGVSVLYNFALISIITEMPTIPFGLIFYMVFLDSEDLTLDIPMHFYSFV